MSQTNKLQPLPISHDAPIGLEGAPESGNRAAATIAGLGAAFVGAVLCAVLLVQTRLQLDVFTVAMGFGVAVAVRKAGGGNTHPFAMTGALCALVGCVLTELFAAASLHAATASPEAHVTGLLVVAQMLDGPDFGLVVRLLQTYFNPLNLIFYAIAILEGYKLSRRPKW